ncbi:hypothetical protein FT663_03497 [Candidozyma haemuli var. vulneris]|uniref:Major facilitator superfamily (MFS) profile domain-containing protein n=1 Tax=Candidozyma haemuli TaxID=45357 RepID=A0A2V1AYI6_9ASCO|nr:hypothetical protein CXQ85_004565 [[Candida] haemuloni]KAF3987974.1 hypothetical protein FT662_03688 [[Candida] haemuloni var. vulneris]KAF3989728.1 hypothetical protein FT663_03497 [[Candida] haemuloni var. vulneris]PVH21901.1 hypothetical protein CXQ85_004565 [[Candida] haemuloni]
MASKWNQHVPDQDLKKETGRDSNELTRHETVSSSDSGDSRVLGKSFGIRKQELMMAQLDSVPLKFFHFFGIFIGMYVSLMEAKSTNVFVGYATSEYKQHSLMSTIQLIRSVVAASSLPAFARLSDIFGRFELFCFGLVLRIVGLVVMSQATSIDKYAGGIVLYGAGFAGARILFQISAQDASTLRTRLLAIAVLSLPVVITTWSSGEVVKSLLDRYHWSFGIGLWAFTFPLSCVPFLCSFLYLKWKVHKLPEWKKLCEEERDSQVEMKEAREAHKNTIENGGSKVKANLVLAWEYTKFRTVQTFWQVDIVACFFIIAIFGLILVPLTLAGGAHTTWQKASTIVPLVLGFCLIPLFVLWETKWARIPLIPFPLLKDRGVWAGFGIGVMNTFASGIPGAYAYAVLLVGMNASEVVATRTPQLSGFVSAIVLPILGLVIVKVKRTKGFILFGVCVLFVAMGLFVHFRGDNDGVSGKYFRDGLAVAFAIDGFGSGFFMRPVGVSIQSCTNYEYMATVTALFAAIYNIGGACANCVSGAIWTQRMYPTIVSKMKELGVDPALAKPAYQAPYKFIKKHEWGTPARRAVVLAYAELQRQLCIVAICLIVPLLIFTLLLRDHKLDAVQSLEDIEDVEKGAAGAERKKGTVIYTNDDDPIFNLCKKLVGRGQK